jgi:integrase
MKIEKVYRKDLSQWRWKIDVTINGQRIRRADFETKQEAEDAIAALRIKARAHRYGLSLPKPKVTLRHMSSSVTGNRIFQEFVAIVGPDVLLTDLNKSDWKQYVDVLRSRDCKPGTINRYMAEVSGLLSSASEIFEDLEEWRPPKAPWLPDPVGRNRLLSKKELSKILFALRAERQFHEQYFSVKNRAEVFDLFRLMLLTGAREGEILSLRQDDVSWDWKTIKIVATKTNTVRVVPLSGLALEILKTRNHFSINKDKLYRVLRKIGESSGVEYGDNIQGGWVLYDLRHVAATVLENSGAPYSAVSAILGHKRTDQTATYAHAQLDTLRKAVSVLETYCREIDGFVISTDRHGLSQTTTLKAKSG